MPSQSLMTKPSKPSLPLSTSVISSWLACILIGLPTPSSVQSTLENDGITVPTSCCGRPGSTAQRVSQKSSRLVIATPWSIV